MSLNHSTRTDDAYSYLRQKIIDGEIPFGTRLHIANLAEETGFSTTPIREALVKLEMYGLAESFPHKGVFVVRPRKRDLLEMIEGRLCIELFMAEAVIKNATSADIAKMRAACASAASNEFGPQMYFEHGLHGVYIQVGENRFLEHLYMRGMALLNVLYIHGLRACTDENWILEYRKQHHQEELDIIDAIEARHLDRLKVALTLHINNFRDFILMTVRSWPPKGLNWNREREIQNDYA